MKTIIVGFVGLMVILPPSEIAFAFGRGGSYSGSRGNFSSSNRYGGSTSHSYGSTSHSNAYGGSSRTPPAKARPTIAPTAPARHTMKAEARLTRTPMAVKRRANTEKARLTRTPTAARRRVNTEKVRRIPTPTAELLRLPTGKARSTRPRMARQPTLPPTIHPLPTMAIIHRPR